MVLLWLIDLKHFLNLTHMYFLFLNILYSSCKYLTIHNDVRTNNNLTHSKLLYYIHCFVLLPQKQRSIFVLEIVEFRISLVEFITEFSNQCWHMDWCAANPDLNHIWLSLVISGANCSTKRRASSRRREWVLCTWRRLPRERHSCWFALTPTWVCWFGTCKAYAGDFDGVFFFFRSVSSIVIQI